MLNKIDRLVIEMKIPPNDAYLKIKHTLEEINSVINKCALKDPNIQKLTVQFAS